MRKAKYEITFGTSNGHYEQLEEIVASEVLFLEILSFPAHYFKIVN